MSESVKEKKRRLSCGLIVGGLGTLLGVLVSCITIFTFVTGVDNIRDFLFGTPVPQERQVVVITAEPSDFQDVPTPAQSSAVSLDPALPTEVGCDQLSGMIWLQFPDLWYGPFYNGDFIQFGSAGGFYVWDVDLVNVYGTLGSWLEYPDPYLQFPRNQWTTLNQSIFDVCVDDYGSVFVVAR